jgi:hypothetical protein
MVIYNQMVRSTGTISISFFGLVFLFVGVNINEPYLISLRDLGTAALFISSVVRARRAEDLGRTQGRDLAALGVNHDFAPVLDLQPEAGRTDLTSALSSISARYRARRPR